MKWLRMAALLYAAAFILGAAWVFSSGQGAVVGFYLALNGLVIGTAIIFERGRYRPQPKSKGDWQTTNEKFQDPTTGKWMAVRYNHRTGERDYVEVGQDPKS